MSDRFRNEIDYGSPGALVLLGMGSQSDWDPCMRHAAAMLDELQIPFSARILSAHRTPDRMRQVAIEAGHLGYQVIIAGAGMSAHLAGMISAYSTSLVIGVPVDSGTLNGLDALLSTVNMPGGVPVATTAIGAHGAKNAALLAAAALRIGHPEIGVRYDKWRSGQTDIVSETPVDVRRKGI